MIATETGIQALIIGICDYRYFYAFEISSGHNLCVLKSSDQWTIARITKRNRFL